MSIDVEPGGKATTCSSFTLANDVDPIGTAGTYDLFLCVEHPLPWPRDVSEMPNLRDAASLSRSVRVLAVVPDRGDEAGSQRDPSTVMITSWRRTAANRMVGRDHLVGSHEVSDALAVLAAGQDGSWSSSSVPAEILICGHGKRDRCCGNLGTRLDAAVSGQLDDVRVRRCSHTGGHRFAPTGVSFPDGRMWANLTPDALLQITDRSGDTALLHRHQRGSTGFDTWAQVVERAVFDHIGWDWLGYDVTRPAINQSEGGEFAKVSFTASTPAETLDVKAEVAIARKVPVPECGELPTALSKTSVEFRLVNLAIERRR